MRLSATLHHEADRRENLARVVDLGDASKIEEEIDSAVERFATVLKAHLKAHHAKTASEPAAAAQTPAPASNSGKGAASSA